MKLLLPEDKKVIFGENEECWIILKENRKGEYKILFQAQKKEYKPYFIEYLEKKDENNQVINEKILFSCWNEKGKICLYEIDGEGTLLERVQSNNMIFQIRPGIYNYVSDDGETILYNANKAQWWNESEFNLKKILYKQMINHGFSDLKIGKVDYMEPNEEASTDYFYKVEIGKNETLYGVISFETDSLFKIYPFIYSERNNEVYVFQTQNEKREPINASTFASLLANKDFIKELNLEQQKEEEQKVAQNKKTKQLLYSILTEIVKK